MFWRNCGQRPNVTTKDELHLGVSMRSFRAEHVSLLVKQLLDLDKEAARETLGRVSQKYPMVITRDLSRAKRWLKEQARGSERYGIVVSSQAERLKPHAIDVRSPMDPIHWFLDGPEDVRSSFYLEDVATEFHVQGLELDWACITWDADFRYSDSGWEHRSFTGDRWNYIHKQDRKTYQKNAYRVLLTRARQGMAIVVPSGRFRGPTRKPSTTIRLLNIYRKSDSTSFSSRSTLLVENRFHDDERRKSGSGSATFSGMRMGLPSNGTKLCSNKFCGK